MEKRDETPRWAIEFVGHLDARTRRVMAPIIDAIEHRQEELTDCNDYKLKTLESCATRDARLTRALSVLAIVAALLALVTAHIQQ